MCAECATRYDSDQNAFCPRCGSTERGKAVPGAIAVARRNDPSRRRVQASGVLLAAVGLLFLASSIATLVATAGGVPNEFGTVIEGQPGGTLVVRTPDNATFDATLSSLDGEPLANVTAAPGEWTIKSPRAAARLEVAWDGQERNGTVFAMLGDRFVVEADELGDEPLASGGIRTMTRVTAGLTLGLCAILMAGGVAAVALRAWPLAVVGASVGAFLGLMSLFVLLLPGLLFALPFGFAATFILRGRRHFPRKQGGPPAKSPQAPPGTPPKP